VVHNRNTFHFFGSTPRPSGVDQQSGKCFRTIPDQPKEGQQVRIAMLSYRSKPHCGGQGIYLRHLSRELVALGHEVEVFSGQPYPELDEGVALTKVPSLDLYREPDPFRVPHPREFRDRIDVEEFATMCVAGFPEPKTFSSRVARILRERAGDFDIAHDNQVLGYGMLDIEQQTIKPIRLVQPPGLVMLHGHVENLIAVRGSLRCRLRRAVFRWFHPFNMSHFVRLMTRHLRNDEPLWLCHVCQIADLIVGCD